MRERAFSKYSALGAKTWCIAMDDEGFLKIGDNFLLIVVVM
jgi:hypothetical protein